MARVQNLFSTLSSGKKHRVPVTFQAVEGAASPGSLCLPFKDNIVVLSSRVEDTINSSFMFHDALLNGICDL